MRGAEHTAARSSGGGGDVMAAKAQGAVQCAQLSERRESQPDMWGSACVRSERGRARDEQLWRVALAELCGTALLVLLSCLAGCAPGATPLHRALAAGFVVTLLVQSLDHVSGAFFNPTVLLAAALWGRVAPPRAAALLGAQLAGGALGALVLRVLQPEACGTCVTLPAPGLPIYKALLLEGVAGGCLALVNCGTWDARSATLRDSWPLRIGITVAALSLIMGELTGASMNPARSLGPALVSGRWARHWVYWVAPLGGSLLFTLAYLAAWRPLSAPTARERCAALDCA